MRRTMAALTSTFIFPSSSSFFFSRLLCRLLSGAALHFFLWKRFFWSAEAASFFIRKDGATFSNARPAFPVGSPEPVTFWFIAIFLLFLRNSDSIGLKCFKIKCSKFTSLKLIFAFNCLIELEKNFKNEEKSGKFSRVHFEFLAIFSYFLRQFSKIISLNLISKISSKIKKNSKKYGKF